MKLVNEKRLNSPLLVFVLLIASVTLNIFLYFKAKDVSDINVVERVIDGDTFVLSFGQRVRLRNVDSPELGLCGSNEAKSALEKIILKKRVELKDYFTDQYGRIEAFVYVGNIFVNNQMVKEGWAKFDSNKSSQAEILKLSFQNAQNNNKGVFSPLCRQKNNSDNPKCNIKGNIGKDNSEKIYFYPGCQSYEMTLVEKDRGEEWFCTEKDAVSKGYKKGSNCP